MAPTKEQLTSTIKLAIEVHNTMVDYHEELKHDGVLTNELNEKSLNAIEKTKSIVESLKGLDV